MPTRLDPISRMPLYGPEHIAVLVVAVAAGIVLVSGARRISGTRHEGPALRMGGWTLLAVTLCWMVWSLLPGHWNIDQSLPFHYTDALRIIASIALITRSGWSIAITYYWGLTLNLQSVITPDLNYFQLPVIEFAAFWFLHIAVLLTPIVLTWGFGYRPTWRGFGVAYGATVAWACLAVTVNGITNANYAYLSRAPQGPSVLDLMGDWPAYVLWEALLVAVIWALITAPWNTRGRRTLPSPDRHRTVRRWVPEGRRAY